MGDLIPSKIYAIAEHNVRNKEDIKDTHAATDKYKDSAIVDGVRLWNELSDDLKQVDNTNYFSERVTASKTYNDL